MLSNLDSQSVVGACDPIELDERITICGFETADDNLQCHPRNCEKIESPGIGTTVLDRWFRIRGSGTIDSSPSESSPYSAASYINTYTWF